MARPRVRASTRSALVLLTPSVAGFVVFYLAPIVVAVARSLTATRRASTYGPAVEVFAGLDNYVFALTDRAFLSGIGRVLLFGVIQIPVMLGLALALALMIDSA